MSHLFSVTWSLTLFSPSLCSQKAEGTTTLVHSSFAPSPLLMPQAVDFSYRVLHYCTKVKGVFIIIHLTEPANLFVVTDSQLETFPSQLLKDSLWWHLQTHNFTEPGRESESPCHTRSAVKFTQLVTQTAPPPPVPSPLVHSPGHRPLSQVLKYGYVTLLDDSTRRTDPHIALGEIIHEQIFFHLCLWIKERGEKGKMWLSNQEQHRPKHKELKLLSLLPRFSRVCERRISLPPFPLDSPTETPESFPSLIQHLTKIVAPVHSHKF